MTELSQYAFERDRHEFSLGDTLDVKAGVLLASLTFLAIQSGSLIPTRSLGEAIIETISIVALIFGGIFSAMELWPRDYQREATPDQYAIWTSELERFATLHPEEKTDPANSLAEARLSAAMERIRINGSINSAKSKLLFVAFYCVLASFAANTVTLIMRLF